MCGRFTLHHTWRELWEIYRLSDADRGRNDEARYNIDPTQEVPFVTAGDSGVHQLRQGRWWPVPWWAKEMPK